MQNSVQKGFTLIELMVVITIIGLLSAALITSLSGPQQVAQQAVDEINLRWHYGQLIRFKQQFGHFPREEGHNFVLAPWVYGIVEHTEANRDRYFSAALSNDAHMLDLKSQPVEEIWKSFDSLSSKDTHFAGRRKQGRRRMTSGKAPLMCTDNEGGNTYHNGTVLVLMGDGTVKKMPRIPDQLRYGAPEDPDIPFTMPVGPESPHPMLAKMRR